MRSNLADIFALPQASRYMHAENASDKLPLLYGDLTENSTYGVFVPPCIDTENYYYCLSCSPILSEINGNIIYVYLDDVLQTSGYTVVTDEDLEGQGRIAYLSFETQPSSVVTVSCSGVASSGVLLTNPIAIIEDLLERCGDTTARNINSFTQAKYAAAYYSYSAAGILLSDNTGLFWVQNILSSFLGGAWFNNQGELMIRIDTPLLSTYQIAGIISERDCRGWSASQHVNNLINRAPVNYALSYTTRDRRYSEDVRGSYFQSDDGVITQDTFSVARYGIRQPTQPFELDWTRNTITATYYQERIIDKFSRPIWLVRVQELGLKNIHVEKGDFLAYSWEERRDEQGLPLRNQIAQVLTKDIDADLEIITWELRDTGTYLASAPYIWDGSVNTGSGVTFGGSRDRRIL